MNTRQLCKEDVEKLSIFIVLSTYYLTFRLVCPTGISFVILLIFGEHFAQCIRKSTKIKWNNALQSKKSAKKSPKPWET